MGKVAREMVEKAGLNIDQLLAKLVAAAGAEFTTFYYYTILRVAAIGMEGEGIKEIIEDARIEDRNHFEALVPRIYELGGTLPRDIREFADLAGCPDAYLPDSLKGGEDSDRQSRSKTCSRFSSKPNAVRSALTPTCVSSPRARIRGPMTCARQSSTRRSSTKPGFRNFWARDRRDTSAAENRGRRRTLPDS